jgi:hypothetical protein
VRVAGELRERVFVGDGQLAPTHVHVVRDNLRVRA